MNAIDPYAGAIAIGEDHTLPTLWAALHMSAKVANDFEDDTRVVAEVEGMETSDRYLLGCLSDIEAKAWSDFCQSVGWTIYGAVALSWCKNAQISKVAKAWAQSGFPLKPSAAFYRATRLIKPETLSRPDSLRQICEIAANNPTLFCLFLADRTRNIHVDLTHGEIDVLPKEAQTFLRAATKRP